jgi:hypothetical protein
LTTLQGVLAQIFLGGFGYEVNFVVVKYLTVMYYYGTHVTLNMDNTSVCFDHSKKVGNVELLLA